MKALIFCLFILMNCLFSYSVFAQTPTPTSTPIANDEDVVKISTTLIQVDVTVTDKNGKIIKDLKPEDFEIYENQTKQTITNFSFIQSERATQKSLSTEKATKPEKGSVAVPIPPARLKVENIRRTMAFVVDDLTLDFDSIYFTRKALKKFVDEKMQDGDLIAIIQVSAGVGALQQFTSDKRLLYAAIEGIKWKPNATNYASASFAAFQTDPTEQASQNEAELKKIESERSEYQQEVFASGTLGAVGYVINGMKELPGRKSVMLVSDQLKLVLRTRQEVIPLKETERILNRLAEEANRSAVVIYTMTANGVPYDRWDATTDNYPNVNSGDGDALQIAITAKNEAQLDRIEARDGLVKLAKDTGGLAIINQKELIDNIGVMEEDQRSYYLIGYQPDEATFDAKTAKFNRFFIKVNRPDAIVRYRSGFFGATDEEVKKTETATSVQSLDEALSSPFAKNDINIHLAALFGNISKGSFVRSFLYIQTKDLTFTDEPDGSKKATFDIAAFAAGADGVPISQIGKNQIFRVSAENYKQLLGKGFVYNFNVPIRKPGAYQLRVAVRDVVSSKIGSATQFIEVPNLGKKRLTLSGITLADYNVKEWQDRQNINATEDSSVELTKAKNDTAFRHFKRGSILKYGYTIYNAQLDKSTKQPNLQAQIKLFRDGKLILNGEHKSIDLNGQSDLARISVNNAISLAGQMLTGEYVLQIVVTDMVAKKNIGTQWVDFEVVE